MFVGLREFIGGVNSIDFTFFVANLNISLILELALWPLLIDKLLLILIQLIHQIQHFSVDVAFVFLYQCLPNILRRELCLQILLSDLQLRFHDHALMGVSSSLVALVSHAFVLVMGQIKVLYLGEARVSLSFDHVYIILQLSDLFLFQFYFF